ncbi:hypothetical protein T459_14840 [Capsicum annuum]|uniref:Uncharacterized protein n=1 Tax=Capsicum annuum TaxID=4072 RepID=A0A2G2ZIS1_CAPAN|nr:hypothetical protein T459_14840 [Capsicum annuum]
MTADNQVHDTAMTVAATSITTMSRTNAPQVMAPAEKPKNFTDQGEEKIYMANSAIAKVEGTGNVCLKTTSGKVLTLNNVLQAAIGRAGSMMYNGKSRHIRWRHNTIRELLCSGIITVDYVQSKDKVSDPLTKGLSREGVERTSKGMVLRPRISQHRETLVVAG